MYAYGKIADKKPFSEAQKPGVFDISVRSPPYPFLPSLVVAFARKALRLIWLPRIG